MDAATIIQRNEKLKSARSNFANRWDDAATWILPRKGGILSQKSPGSDQASDLFDSTAEKAALVYAAGLLSSLTPAGEQWMRLEVATPNASDAVKDFLTRASEAIQERLLASNFYLSLHEAFIDSGVFCTVCIFTGESEKTGVSFTNIPVGTFCVSENNEGMVDTLFREWKWNARQAVQEWGKEKLGEQVMRAFNSGDWEREFTFIHAVEPRFEFEKGVQIDAKKRPIASYYVCVEDKNVIEEGGYYEMPYAVLRTLRSNNELYGRGPGLQCMPEVKLVNRMEKGLLVATEKMVDPPWLMPEDSSYQPDNRPNGVTYWDSTNAANKPEQLQLTNRIDLGENKTEQKRDCIREAFFVDMFQMLTNLQERQREKTAFEVSEMLQEKLVLFSPIFARTVQELLNPLIERVFAILIRSGAFPNIPPELGEYQYRITYVSKIALALKTAKTSALAQVMTVLGAMIPFDPSVKHLINWRKAAREVANNYALPMDWQRSETEVDEIVEGETQAAMQMQQAALAKDVSQAARNLGPTAQEAATKTLTNGSQG